MTKYKYPFRGLGYVIAGKYPEEFLPRVCRFLFRDTGIQEAPLHVTARSRPDHEIDRLVNRSALSRWNRGAPAFADQHPAKGGTATFGDMYEEYPLQPGIQRHQFIEIRFANAMPG